MANALYSRLEKDGCIAASKPPSMLFSSLALRLDPFSPVGKAKYVNAPKVQEVLARVRGIIAGLLPASEIVEPRTPHFGPKDKSDATKNPEKKSRADNATLFNPKLVINATSGDPSHLRTKQIDAPPNTKGLVIESALNPPARKEATLMEKVAMARDATKAKPLTLNAIESELMKTRPNKEVKCTPICFTLLWLIC